MLVTTRRVSSVFARSLSFVSAACSGLEPFMTAHPFTAPAVRPDTI